MNKIKKGGTISVAFFNFERGSLCKRLSCDAWEKTVYSIFKLNLPIVLVVSNVSVYCFPVVNPMMII